MLVHAIQQEIDFVTQRATISDDERLQLTWNDLGSPELWLRAKEIDSSFSLEEKTLWPFRRGRHTWR